MTSYKYATRTSEIKSLKEKYGVLFDNFVSLLDEADPVGLSGGHYLGEYTPEVSTILPKLMKSCTLQDVENILYSEFCSWFGDHENDPPTVAIVGPREIYKPIAVRILVMWNEFNGKSVC